MTKSRGILGPRRRESGRTALLTLRMATDESHPRVLRRWSDTDGWQEVTPHT